MKDVPSVNRPLVHPGTALPIGAAYAHATFAGRGGERDGPGRPAAERRRLAERRDFGTPPGSKCRRRPGRTEERDVRSRGVCRRVKVDLRSCTCTRRRCSSDGRVARRPDDAALK
jgi:hypothetical protein